MPRLMNFPLLPVALIACSENTTPTAAARPDVARAAPIAECVVDRRYCYSAPVHLGPLINTAAFEGGPSLSANGLELYFVSGRSGALGGAGDQDIYVSRRRSIHDQWEAPVRVPPPISSPFFDITPSISRDGLSLYFASNRPGPFSPPMPDLWVAHRASPTAPWGDVTNLGPNVNTPLFEGSTDHGLTALSHERQLPDLLRRPADHQREREHSVLDGRPRRQLRRQGYLLCGAALTARRRHVEMGQYRTR